MRVVMPPPAPPCPERSRTGTAVNATNVEFVGLAVATGVVLAGTLLVYLGQMQSLAGAAPNARPIVRTAGEFAVTLARSAGLFLIAFWTAHAVRRWQGVRDDAWLLPIVATLSGIGLIAMVALRDPLRDTILVHRFAQGVTGGVALLLGISAFDFEASRLRRAVMAPLLVALGLAAALLVFGSGPGTSGVKVNLFGAQPVEAIRLLVVFALAAFFAPRLDFLREYSEPPTASRPWLKFVGLPRWKDVGPVVVAMSLVLMFFFLQKDLGPALVLTFVFLGLYGIARGRIPLVLVGIGILLSAFLMAYELGFPATVRQRVAMWIAPWSNAAPGGDQIAHGLWALATGAVWGTGPGLGDPQLIPAGHTDFVLAAIGEELGFAGLAVVFVLYGLLCWRSVRIALRAPGDYTALLALGAALGLLIQAFVIGGGLLGILPLSGVVTPFLSYGRSSMLANFAAVGVILSVARRAGPERLHLSSQVRVLVAALVVMAVGIASRAAWVQVVRADAIALAPSLTRQADGGSRFQYNPRLLAAARLLSRGSIYDRNGLVLATSRPDEIHALDAAYRKRGISPQEPCDDVAARCYPLGAAAFHLVGNATHQTNWASRNSSFLERDSEATLRGFDDRAEVVEVRNRQTGTTERTIARDYRDLLPLLRNRYRPTAPAVRALLTKSRDVRSTIDARLQLRAAAALRKGVEAAGTLHGAAVILDVETGDVLAAVSYPWPDRDELQIKDRVASDSQVADRLLDRARYGLYPPGSTFKLLVAAAALRTGQADTFPCVRLPDGRVGAFVPGSTRPIRDDPMDTFPHGRVDLEHGLVSSCNAYFAQLALRVGPQPLLDAASLLQIDMCQPATAAALRRTLAQTGYGQGHVVVSPLKMARVAAAIAGSGRVPQVRWVVPPKSERTREKTPAPSLLSPGAAAQLARYMREVVTSGTGRSLAGNPTPIAGKTGTAEVDDARAHSWFAGFAPYGGGAQRRIAFAVVIENAGYGGRAAAPVAGELVSAARDLGLIR